MKNYVTCHCHQQSLDTASTPEAFAAKEIELGTGYLTVTDHGTLQAARKVFDLAKKKKLTPIIGLEAYLRDDDCSIIKATGADLEEYLKFGGKEKKYMHVTMHFLDQEAYELGVKILSKADARAEKHGSERKPLFAWSDLEELGAKNVTMTSSCLIGAVQRHLLAHDNVDMAIAHYEKLRAICKPGNFYSEIFPHVCDRNWLSAGIITYADGTEEKFRDYKKLKLKDGGEGQLKEFARHWKRGREDQLLSVMENRKWADREPKAITNIEVREGFVINDCRPWTDDADVQKGCNSVILALAAKYGDKILIGDDSHFAKPEEKVVQDIRLQAGGGSWRFSNSYHRQSSEESFAYFRDHMGVSEKEFTSWVENTYEWAEKFKGFNFKVRKSLPTSFYPKDTLSHTMALIEKHGRMRWDNQAWVERLSREIEMLHENGAVDLLPYFFIDEEVCEFFNKLGKLTGPGRGSAAGMLLAYLLRITHVDPIYYELSMERFLTASRVRSGKFPDIDQDLSKKYRELLTDPVTGWLRNRFGDCQAHISVDTTLKLRSSVLDVARVIHDGAVPPEISGLTKRFENAPQGISDHDFVFGYKGSGGWVDGSILTDTALIEYVTKFPEEWSIVQKCLGLTRQKAPHACAFVIADEPISNFIPMTSCGDEPVTQYTAPSVEAVGGLKMDFLGLNSLDDIAVAIKLVQDRSGWTPVDMFIDGEKVLAHEIVPFKGKFYSVWKLPEDQAVFRDICEQDTETVFQFSTPGMMGWLKHFDKVKEIRPDGTVVKALNCILDLSALTALDRPGPLDYFVETPEGSKHNMLVEFARRSAGIEAVGEIPALTKILPETYGVIVYQEQLQRIFQVLGNTTLEEADEFRIHISKKQAAKVIEDKVVFMRGAVAAVGADTAQNIWDSMETFAAYGFNKSHSTAYVIISYACAFLKHHFALEWWTAVLNHADKDEISTKFWKHCGSLIDLPDVAISGDGFEIRNERIRAPLNLLLGVGPAAQAQLSHYRPYSSLEDFCAKIVKHQLDNSTTIEKKVEVQKPLLDADGEPLLDINGEPRVETVEETQSKLKKGHNALNKGVIATLIVSGAMDSFFPPDTLVVDAMDKYVETFVRAQGKKRVTKADLFDPKYLNMNPLVKYQMRKSVLPAYSEPILPALFRANPPGLIANDGTDKRPEFKIGSNRAPFAALDEIEYMGNRRPWPDDFMITAAACGYVAGARKFNFGAGREALELILDMDGGQMKAVKWGSGKAGKLPPHLADASALAGSIACVLYTKYSEDKPFVIDDLAVIQPPLNHHTAETSPEPTP